MTSRLLTRASALVLVVAVLAGCSWRLETPTPDWPAPDTATRARDAAAEREYEILQLATNADAQAAGTSVGIVLSEIQSEQAHQRLDTLGGVYEPYPNSTPVPEAAPLTNIRDAVAQASATYMADALASHDADVALVMASAGLSHALALWYATWVEDAIGAADHAAVMERTVPGDVLGAEAGVLPSSAVLPTQTLAELAVMHDQARYMYEVMAARAVEDEREQWLARRDIQAARSDALVSLNGVADHREATYIVRSELSEDSAARLEAAQQLEADAGATYAALLADADQDQWPWLLHAAFDAYAQAAAFGEPTATGYPVPALPGIEVN